MKKIIIFAIATAFLAASCQREDIGSHADEVTVSLSLELPEALHTKAMSNAESTDIVYYEIWDSNWDKQLYPAASATVSNKQAQIELKLVKSLTYNFIFWAQNSACGAYDTADLTKVEVDYTVMAAKGNSDKFDAFFSVDTIAVNGPINQTVTLERPFAQINFGANAMQTMFGDIVVENTEVTVSHLATVFNTINGCGETQTAAPVTFSATGLATDEILETNNAEYTWVTMDYALMMSESDNVEVTGTFHLEGAEYPVVHNIPSVPLKKNHRTNIVGDLFTSDATLNIYVDQAFDEPDEVVPAL